MVNIPFSSKFDADFISDVICNIKIVFNTEKIEILVPLVVFFNITAINPLTRSVFL